MTAVFLKLFNMSITASWIALAVILLRIVLKKAPRYLVCIMWALVGLRLIFPISIESVLSLIPSAETVPQEIVYAEAPMIHSGVSFVNSAVNPIISTTLAPTPIASMNPMQIVAGVASVVWVLGMAVMLLYTLLSYLRIRLKVREGIILRDNIMICDRVASPFILGIIKPRIYLPSSTGPQDMEYIIAHEMAHLKRRDHLWKPLGFLLLTVYWFNPMLWVAYVLLCRDIELACDEKVIRAMGSDAKKPYSEALITCSASRRMISACPLAFGEVGVKSRIKAVLNYKKPAFWIIILALISCIVLAVCFLTDPKDEDTSATYFAVVSQESSSELEGVWAEITETDFESESPTITVVWHNDSEYKLTFGDEFYIYRNENGEYTDMRTHEDYVYHLIGHGILPGGTFEKTYSLWAIDISKAGKYLYVTNCLIDGSNPVPDGLKKYDVIIDFELDRGAENSGNNIPNSDNAIPSDLVCTITQNCIIPDSNEILTDVDGNLARELYAMLLSIHTSAEMAELSEGTDEADYLQLVFRRSSGTDYDPTSSMLYTMDHGIYIVFENDYISYARSMYHSATYSFKAPDGTYEKIKEMIFGEEMVSSPYDEIWSCTTSPEMSPPTVYLNTSDNTCQFSYSMFSSYLAIGHYEWTDTSLILRTDDGQSTYVFNKAGDTLTFDAKASSPLPKYKYSGNATEALPPVADGAVFNCVRKGEDN